MHPGCYHTVINQTLFCKYTDNDCGIKRTKVLNYDTLLSYDFVPRTRVKFNLENEKFRTQQTPGIVLDLIRTLCFARRSNLPIELTYQSKKLRRSIKFVGSRRRCGNAMLPAVLGAAAGPARRAGIPAAAAGGSVRPALYEKKKSDFQSQTFKLDFCNPREPDFEKSSPYTKKVGLFGLFSNFKFDVVVLFHVKTSLS